MPAKLSIPAAALRKLTGARSRTLAVARAERQPIHTVYGGAHLFKRGSAARIGDIALASLDAHAPDEAAFAAVFGVGAGVLERVRSKLAREAVEDFRVDFEDGFGFRPDTEEDAAAIQAAGETAAALKAKSLPPFFGVRVKGLGFETRARSLRTLDLYLTALLAAGPLPENFVVTLPKVTNADEVKRLVQALALIERARKCRPIPIEIMVETPRCLIDAKGAFALRGLEAAGKGRVRGAHFGAYDYTSSLGIASTAQTLDHPACDLARQLMQLAFAEGPVWLSDGATSLLPVGQDRALVHAAWRLHYANVRRALSQGFYQGWDLHPAQLPARYAATYAFFAEGLASATARLKSFVEKAAQASLTGTAFDDAATGQGLLNFFLRGLACGALTENELAATGLTQAELRTRSFAKIIEGRSS